MTDEQRSPTHSEAGQSRFAGRVAFVTGGARGLGRSHAIRLAREGADIAIMDLGGDTADSSPGYALANAGDLAETAEAIRSLGRQVVLTTGDVRSYQDVERAVEETVGALGRLDVVVANAGVAIPGTAEDTSDEMWERTLGINLTGAWHAAKAAIPVMRRQGYGRIVLISSVGGLKPVSGLAAYSASKAGIISLAKSTALELAPDGITVNAVCPATVLTPLNEHLSDYTEEWIAMQAIPHLVQPQDVSAAVCFLASEEARYVTGHALAVDAGFVIK